MDTFDRYLKIVTWLQRRATTDNCLITHVGMKPTRYIRCERMAANKYLHLTPPLNPYSEWGY